MSGSLSKAFLEQAARRNSDGRIGSVRDDRECLGCGYNLRGLPLGGRCPECGMPVHTPPAGDDPLSLMPVKVIKTFRRGTFLTMFALTCFMVMVVWNAVGTPPPPLAAAIACAIAMLWIAATWLVTPALEIKQARGYGFARRNRTRELARWLQFGWLALAGLAVIEAGMTAPSPAMRSSFDLLGFGCILVGYVGFICLNVMLQRLARWVRDETAAGAMNMTMWALPAAIILGGLQLRIPLMFLVVMGIWIFAIGGFPYGLFLLSKSVMLSVGHAKEYQERLRRRADREQQYHEEIDARMTQMEAPTERDVPGFPPKRGARA